MSPNLEFESLRGHTLKAVTAKGYSNFNNHYAKFAPSMVNFRKPRLVKAKRGWYVEFYFRIPHEIREVHDNKEWLRFRVTDDMNKRKGEDREIFADYVLNELTSALKMGFNPFAPDKEIYQQNLLPEKKELNITDALNLFLEKWKGRGLEPSTYKRYELCVTRLKDWLALKKIPYTEATNFTQDHLESFLSDTKKDFKLSNREYNNHFDFIRTAFNFLLQKKIITDSPCVGFHKLKSKSVKHKFYDSKTLEIITKALKAEDPYLYLAFQCVYYLCVRSGKELRNLKVGNIKWDTDKILVEVSKTDQDYIPMDQHIKPILKNYVKDFPGEYYLFSRSETPGPTPVGESFFSDRFKKVRETAGLDSNYSLYSAKHTRICDLKQDGLDDATIMKLTRHKDFRAYSIYLRDLGQDANPERINDVSRVI